MPVLLNSLAAMFPMGNRCPVELETFDQAMDMLFSYLPPRPRAWSLCKTFYEQSSWLSRPVRQEDLVQAILIPVYLAKEERETLLSTVSTDALVHKLSTTFSIFSLAILGDLTLPAFNEEGERYHHCARASLALRSVLDSPTVDTVQAITFMTVYCSSSVHRYNRDSVWMLASLCCKLAQSVCGSFYYFPDVNLRSSFVSDWITCVNFLPFLSNTQ